MKKSLLSMAALATAIPALGQSSVTLFGVVDVNFQRARQGGVSVDRITSGSQQTSRLGLRGVEKIGDGLSASFWLETTLNADSGTFGTTSTNNQVPVPAASGGLVFDRRSTASVSMDGVGEVRLGRDYAPTFWNLSVFDPYGTVGSGNSRNVSQNTSFGNGGRTAVAIRASNAIQYFLPSTLGGVYGQVMYALGENASGTPTSDDGRFIGARLGYAAGPLNAAIAAGKVKAATGDVVIRNAGVSYDFGFAKLMGQLFYDRNNSPAGNSTQGYLLGATIPVGAGYFPVSLSQNKDKSAAARKASQWAAGYVYNLSKRTATYTTYSRIKNKNGSAVSGGGVPGVANSTWTGLDVGIRHSF